MPRPRECCSSPSGAGGTAVTGEAAVPDRRESGAAAAPASHLPFSCPLDATNGCKGRQPRHKAKAEISPLSLLGLHGPATASNEPQRAATASLRLLTGAS